MARLKKTPICVLIIMMALMSCVSLQQTAVPSTPIIKSPKIPTIVPSATNPVTTTPVAISTPSVTIMPTPSATVIPTVASIIPFRGVISLAGLPVDATGEVQLHVLADDSIWIISSQAAMHWDGHEWEIVVPEIEGKLASVDNAGKLWVMPQETSEIDAWMDGQWTAYGVDSGWMSAGLFEQSWWSTAPWSVSTSSGGTLWVPLEQEVRAFDGNKWRGYTLEDMSFPIQEMEDVDIVHNLATMENSTEVWVGECYYSGPGPMGGGGVRWYDGQNWHGVDAPVSSGCVSALTFDQAGNLWLGVSKSVWCYERATQSWTEFSLPAALLSDFNFTHPVQIIVDQVGDVWVGEQMCGGASCDVKANLYRIHNGKWSLVTDSEYWASSFKKLVLDENGQGWLFWEGMFYRLGNKPLEPITSMDARGVDVSPDGNIWVVTGSGDEASLQVLEP